MRARDEDDIKAELLCAELGLHPKLRPMLDSHHTDADFTDADKLLGERLACFLGTLFADIEDDDEYWYHKRTSVDEWSRVARALRIHGLRIGDAEEP